MGKVFKLLILLTLFVVLIGSIVILAFLPHLVTGSLINKHINFSEVYDPTDWDLQPKFLNLETEDGYTLAAWELKVHQPRATIIFVGGLNDPPVSAFFGHAALLAKEGFDALLIELRSHGESSGEQVYLGYGEHLDILAGLDYLQNQNSDLPVLVFGVDLGGAVAINATGLYPDIAGLISIGAFSSWSDLFRDNLYFSGAPLTLALVTKPFVNLYTLVKFGYENRRLEPKQQIARLDGRPALLMHSQDDQFASVLNLERIMQHIPESEPNVEIWLREGAEHLVCSDFLKPQNDRVYVERLLEFLNQNF